MSNDGVWWFAFFRPNLNLWIFFRATISISYFNLCSANFIRCECERWINVELIQKTRINEENFKFERCEGNKEKLRRKWHIVSYFMIQFQPSNTMHMHKVTALRYSTTDSTSSTHIHITHGDICKVSASKLNFCICFTFLQLLFRPLRLRLRLSLLRATTVCDTIHSVNAQISEQRMGKTNDVLYSFVAVVAISITFFWRRIRVNCC